MLDDYQICCTLSSLTEDNRVFGDTMAEMLTSRIGKGVCSL